MLPAPAMTIKVFRVSGGKVTQITPRSSGGLKNMEQSQISIKHSLNKDLRANCYKWFLKLKNLGQDKGKRQYGSVKMEAFF